MCCLLFHLCPEAVPDSAPPPPRVCQFESLFSGVAKPLKEEFSPVLFHRVAKLLQEPRKKFVEAAEAGKTPHASFPSKKRAPATSSDLSLGKATPFNPSLPRLIGNLSGSWSAGFTVLEAGKLVALSRQLLRVTVCVFLALLCLANSSLASLATFFQAKRRECVLSHFPAHIRAHFCSLLAVSSCDGPNLFEEEVLSRVLAESREDSTVSANLASVKAVSFPVFGAAKSGRRPPLISLHWLPLLRLLLVVGEGVLVVVSVLTSHVRGAGFDSRLG